MFKKITDFNSKIALMVTGSVGTMWCAYVFACLAIYGGMSVDWHNSLQIVTWVSQTFLQLVLLSVIMVGQKVQGEASEQRAIEDHNMIKSEFSQMKDLHEDLRNVITDEEKDEELIRKLFDRLNEQDELVGKLFVRLDKQDEMIDFLVKQYEKE